MPDLFFIEAPFKAKIFQNMLSDIGINARVQATKGHLFEFPENLSDVGIDQDFRDFKRRPRDLKLIERIRQEASIAEKIYIATDADQEGDVIGWDVADLIRDIDPAPIRVRLKGMDAESLKESLAEARPIDKKDAIAGRTRAIIDRLIGASFTTPEIVVGRVATAMLGMVNQKKPKIQKLTLVAPAKDKGRPWSAQTSLNSIVTSEVATRLLSLKFPALDMLFSSEPDRKIGHMGNVMVSAGDQLDISPKETADSMQRLYETGRLSYPRSNSHGVSEAVSLKMVEVIRKAGYPVKGENVNIKEPTDVHDSPYVIGKVNISDDPKKVAGDESVRLTIARDIAKSAISWKCEYPNKEILSSFLTTSGFSPEIVNLIVGLTWKREVGPRYPGQISWPESGITVRRSDVVLLEAMMDSKLGRPSTWANHIEKFMDKKLVDEELNLTSKGQNYLKNSPRELLDVRVSAAIELACEKFPNQIFSDPSREPWEVNAKRIVDALPPKIKSSLMEVVSTLGHHEKIDVVRDYGLARSFVDEARNENNILSLNMETD